MSQMELLHKALVLNPDPFVLLTVLITFVSTIYFWYFHKSPRRSLEIGTLTKTKIVPLSVNFHFTRKCNYECGFCFHTAKSSYLAPLEDVKRGLSKLADKGMKKLNLSGGEPFLYPDHVGEIVKFCKETLSLESVSIVSNGSKIKKGFFEKYGAFLDILAISVDSFDEDTNVKIGRGKGNHLKQLGNISKWCREHNVKFKLNSVINKYNHEEDFSQNIQLLEPFRWKCFQVLQVDTENKGEGAKRDCSRFLISDEDFDKFCRRHRHLDSFVPESNLMMKSSYIILDEKLQFLNKGDVYGESKSILEVDDIEELLARTDYEPETFEERGGIYDWTKSSCGEDANLKW
ncbi:unnamed protein product [Allacma fusca]|uniref:Radical SAM core domain-containing protein n=1 Tax=Allacma fusca TaxID=39272 RepID=A0A8J2Q103_9HEXA|nr:unnamed protein product [Allacma fusca]